MKFGHQWKDRKSRLPPDLASMCIDYKKYKKTTKTKTPPTPEHLLNSIIADSTSCHKLYGHYCTHSKTHRFLPCLSCRTITSSQAPNKEDLLEFAQLNALCLRKLCKRLDKHLKTNIFTQWLNTSHYAFIQGPHITLQKIEHSQKNPDCPICLEDNILDFIILNCGHILCISCTRHMLSASSKGTLPNIIAYAKYHTPHITHCPMCRDPRAFNDYIHINKTSH